jgi:UDP-glucuronate decarboxylase
MNLHAQTGSIEKPRSVLVAGGAGFIGSHLCELLLRQGHEVTCMDNLLTGFHSNIEHFAGSDKFKFHRCDISRPFSIDGKFDVIFNLACPASPVAYQADPIHTLKTSVLGSLHLLDLAREHRAQIIHASTSEVYGDPLHHPQSEADWGNVNPIGPRACYDEGKRCAETLFFDYRRVHHLTIRVARIFNTYGPRMSPADGRVVANFIVQALQNIDITVYGDGRQTRSFCYIDDLVDGMIRLMSADADITGPINLGNPHECSVTGLAKRVIGLTGSRSRIVYRPLPVDDPRQRRPDISRAEHELGWAPLVPLDEGLKRTIAYFDGILKTAGYDRRSSQKLTAVS